MMILVMNLTRSTFLREKNDMLNEFSIQTVCVCVCKRGIVWDYKCKKDTRDAHKTQDNSG